MTTHVNYILNNNKFYILPVQRYSLNGFTSYPLFGVLLKGGPTFSEIALVELLQNQLCVLLILYLI